MPGKPRSPEYAGYTGSPGTPTDDAIKIYIQAPAPSYPRASIYQWIDTNESLYSLFHIEPKNFIIIKPQVVPQFDLEELKDLSIGASADLVLLLGQHAISRTSHLFVQTADDVLPVAQRYSVFTEQLMGMYGKNKLHAIQTRTNLPKRFIVGYYVTRPLDFGLLTQEYDEKAMLELILNHKYRAFCLMTKSYELDDLTPPASITWFAPR